MKKLLTIFLSLSITMTLTQCTTSVNEVCKNDKTRGEAISFLLNNHEYTQQLMDSMMANKHSMQMMHGENGMMKKMSSDTSFQTAMMNHMMEMCKKDSNMCSKMMNKTMEMCDQDESKCKIMSGSMKSHKQAMDCMNKSMNSEDMKMDHSHHH